MEGHLGATYIIPDGHDQHHRVAGEGRVELGEPPDLVEAVAVPEDVELGGAVVGRDGAAVREAVVGRLGDQDLLSVLDEVLGQVVLGELGHDCELLAGVNCLALAIEIRVAVSVWVVVATVGIAVAGESVLGICTAAAVGLAYVVGVVRARVGGQCEGVRVGLPR